MYPDGDVHRSNHMLCLLALKYFHVKDVCIVYEKPKFNMCNKAPKCTHSGIIPLLNRKTFY